MTKPENRVSELIGLLGILAAGLGLRLYLLGFKAVGIGSDEAIIGLMARHILQGERPILYYGQAYYGALDAYLTAPLFAVLGDNDFTLRIVPLAASLLFVLVIYQLGKALYSPQVGLWSAAYAAVAPAFLALRGIKGDAAYSLVLLVSALALLLFQRLLARFSWKRLAGLVGLCLLGLWIFPLMAYAIAAMGLTGLFAMRLSRQSEPRHPSNPGRVRALGIFLAVLLLAAALLLGWLGAGRGYFQNFLTGTGRFFSISFPILIGLFPPMEHFPSFEQQMAYYPAALRGLMVVLGLALFGMGVYSGVSRFRQGKRLLFVFVSCTLLIFILFFSMINITSNIFSFPRYLFPLYCAIPLWVDAFLRFTAGRRILRLAGAGLILGINLAGNWLQPAIQAPAPALLAWSQSQVEWQYVYVDYWKGYWLAFESHEQVIPYIIENNRPGNNRYQPYAEQVQGASKPAYIYPALSAEAEAFQAYLEQQSILYEVEQAGGYQIFHDLSKPVRFGAQGMNVD